MVLYIEVFDSLICDLIWFGFVCLCLLGLICVCLGYYCSLLLVCVVVVCWLICCYCFVYVALDLVSIRICMLACCLDLRWELTFRFNDCWLIVLVWGVMLCYVCFVCLLVCD